MYDYGFNDDGNYKNLNNLIEGVKKHVNQYQQQPKQRLYQYYQSDPQQQQQLYMQQMRNFQQQQLMRQGQGQMLRPGTVPAPPQPQAQPYPQQIAQQVQQNSIKPSDIKTDSLVFITGKQLQSCYRYSSNNKEILTKIHFGNKSFVFQVQDKDNTNRYEQDSNQISNSQVNADDEKNKLKAEIKFEDIDSIELNIIENYIEISTRAQIKQYKLDNSQKKQNWYLNDFFQQDGPIAKIILKYSKDILTKSLHGQKSNAERIKLYESSFKNFKLVGEIPMTQPQSEQQPQLIPSKTVHTNGVNNPQMQTSQQSLYYYPRQDQQENQSYQGPAIQNGSYQSQSSNQLSSEQERKIITRPKDAKNGIKQEKQESVQNLNQEDSFEIGKGQDGLTLTEKDLEIMFPKISAEEVTKIVSTYEKKPLTQDEKFKKLFDEYKIKQFKNNQFTSQPMQKCPYFRCSKSFTKPQSLKNHLKKTHPRLNEIDFSVDDNGVFSWNEKALDYCLLVAQIYPQFFKHIIKEMKQRKDQTQ